MTVAHYVANLSDPISPIIDFNGAVEDIGILDLSASNPLFSALNYTDTRALNSFIESEKLRLQATILIGGYNEDRKMYQRSTLFDNNLQTQNAHSEEPRSIHLGIDVWADAGTRIHAPIAGKVHSFAHNNHFGDYGPTIILKHDFTDGCFYSLYGHLSEADLMHLEVGKPIQAGEPFAHFGTEKENGEWPPHLHFQLMMDIGEYAGDYPGVCKKSESAFYLGNCPDPRILLCF